MSDDVIIRSEGLGKSYFIGHEAEQERYIALRDIIARRAKAFFRTTSDMLRGRALVAGDTTEEIWALKDINFEVRRGEVLGIIGRNGAGKSTLLKIISRITEPTAGQVEIRGRVASLLEVGTGFHPELTGRENIYLNGAILGMTRAEIRRKFDEIVAFAEVEKFLDTPVKRYSSGMYVRLAFAVAAHLEPEILVVDEVLAVGDVEFQKKCVGKMGELSDDGGRTVLFVSHNVGMITSLCPSVIWLEKGSLRNRGDARAMISEYLAQGTVSQEKTIQLGKLSHGDRFCFESLEWLSAIPLRHGEPVKARIRFTTKGLVTDVAVGIGFSGLEGKRLLTYETDFPSGARPSIAEPGTHTVDIEIDTLPLGPDIYDLDIGSRSGDFHSLAYIPACARLEIMPGSSTPATIIRKDSGVRLPSNCSWFV
jgi:lipopolysaccharide transport system ATP-binding protein